MDVLCDALQLRRYHSPLLRHEIGYVLGQMQSQRACSALEAVLVDTTDDVMVRHECAEALGAIGAARSVPLLDRLADPAGMVEIRSPKAVVNWEGSRGERSEGLAQLTSRIPPSQTGFFGELTGRVKLQGSGLFQVCCSSAPPAKQPTKPATKQPTKVVCVRPASCFPSQATAPSRSRSKGDPHVETEGTAIHQRTKVLLKVIVIRME